MKLPSEVEQVDCELTEDGSTVILIGHTDNEDRTYIASIELAKPIEEIHFDPDPTKWQRRAKEWVLHA